MELSLVTAIDRYFAGIRLYLNSPTILRFLMILEKIRKLSSYRLINIYSVCYEITYWLEDEETRKETCNRLGLLFYMTGENDKAMKQFKHFLSLTNEANDGEAGEKYRDMGNGHALRGFYLDALICFEKSLLIFEEIKDKANVSKACGNIGKVRRQLGQYPDALKYHKEQLHISEDIGDRSGVAMAYNAIGKVHRSLGHVHDAIHFTNDSIVRLQNLRPELPSELSREVLRSQADDCRSLGDHPTALEKYNALLLSCEKERDEPGMAVAYYNISKEHQSLGHKENAIQYYLDTLKISKKTGNVLIEARANRRIGYMYLDEGNLELAEGHLTESVRCYEGIFKSLRQHEELKISVADTKFGESRKLLMETYIRSGDYKNAVLVMDGNRSLALNDRLREDFEEADPGVLHFNDISSLSSGGSTFVLYALSADRNHLYTFVISTGGQVSFREKSTAQIKLDTFDDSDCNDIEQLLSMYVKDIAAIEREYLHARELLACVTKTKRERKIEEEVHNEDVDVEAFFTAPFIKEGQNENTSEDQDKCEERVLTLLYKILFADIEDELDSGSEVVIFPEGPLFSVPYPALKNKRGKHLIETKRLRVCSSIHTLKLIKAMSPNEMLSTHGALIVGAPEVGKVIYRGNLMRPGVLVGAEKEALMIGNVLGASPLIGRSATKDEVLRRLQSGDVHIAHFATHGSSGELLLAPTRHSNTRIPSEQDYMLTIKEINSIKISVSLVVLSTCHSGCGEIRAEGVLGIKRGFIAAGARSVLATKWDVDDEATMFFMEHFYLHFTSGESACASLKQAMIEMKESGKWSHWRHWAAFFIEGDDIKLPVCTRE